jgi:putative membrane protein insertion efficiency factor
MRGTIRFYQVAVSRINPDRCGFRPSCSAFAAWSIREYGPVTGMMMTADRLMRCNIWKKPGPDYLLLPGGKLLDPPWQNLVKEGPNP